MKYTRFLIIGLGVVLLAYFVFVVNWDLGRTKTQSADQQTNKDNFATRTDEQGQVSVTVTPQTFIGAQWRFDIVFDTHSVDLNEDPMQVVVLVDDRGNTYKPITWEGPGPGGHHREGVLFFAAINPVPSYVGLKVKNVGGIPERLFQWNVE